MNKKFLPWFLLFCAIGLSGTAAYYSVVGLSIRFCYRSKCYKIECGCLKIYRDTDDEKEIDEMGIQYHGNEEENEDEKNM